MILRELLAKFGVDFDDAGAKKAEHSLEHIKHKSHEAGEGFEELKEGAKRFLEILGGAEILKATYEFVEGQIKLGTSIGIASERIGIGVERLQAFRFAGSDAALSAEGVDAALMHLSRTQAEAAAGQTEAGQAFAALGVGLGRGQLAAMSFDEVLDRVADGMAKAKTQGDRLRIGQKLFGREGVRFTELMKNGSKGLEQFKEEAEELGFILSKSDVEAARKAESAIEKFGGVIQGVKNQLAAYFIPKLTAAVNAMREWVGEASKMAKGTDIIAAAAVTAGVAVAAMFGVGTMAAVIGAGLAFAAIAVAIEDIIGFVQGKDSVIGRFIDQFKGIGGSAVALENWKAGLKIISDYAESFYKNLRAGWEILQKIGEQRGKEKEAARRTEFDSEHAQWERRKKWVDAHPNAPEFMRQLGKEPVWRPTAPGGGDAWEELRTREVATGQGVNASAQSAEEHALEQRRQTAEAVAAGRGEGKHVTVNQHNTVNVNASGTDAKEVARQVRLHHRKMAAEGHAEALRAVRQVPAR